MNPRIRCAIYTRKSSEEGLEQSFNSLDAQREACEAFVKSQQHEGWQTIATHYDDGGFSGGNMDRPALKQLMIIHSDHVEVRLRTQSLVNEILGGAASIACLLPIASIECPFRHVRQGRAVRLVVGNANLTTDASRKAILKAIARARRC